MMKFQPYLLAVPCLMLSFGGCASKTDDAVALKQETQETQKYQKTEKTQEMQNTPKTSDAATDQSNEQEKTKSTNNTPSTLETAKTKPQRPNESQKQIQIASEKFKAPPLTKEEVSKIVNTEVSKVDNDTSDERFPLFVYSGPSDEYVISMRMIRGEYANSTFDDDKTEKGAEMMKGLRPGDEALWNANHNVFISHTKDFTLRVNIGKDVPERQAKAMQISNLVWKYLTN